MELEDLHIFDELLKINNNEKEDFKNNNANSSNKGNCNKNSKTCKSYVDGLLLEEERSKASNNTIGSTQTAAALTNQLTGNASHTIMSTNQNRASSNHTSTTNQHPSIESFMAAPTNQNSADVSHVTEPSSNNSANANHMKTSTNQNLANSGRTEKTNQQHLLIANHLVAPTNQNLVNMNRATDVSANQNSAHINQAAAPINQNSANAYHSIVSSSTSTNRQNLASENHAAVSANQNSADTSHSITSTNQNPVGLNCATSPTNKNKDSGATAAEFINDLCYENGDFNKTMESVKSASSCGASALEVARNLVGADFSDEEGSDEKVEEMHGLSAAVAAAPSKRKKSILNEQQQKRNKRKEQRKRTNNKWLKQHREASNHNNECKNSKKKEKLGGYSKTKIDSQDSSSNIKGGYRYGHGYSKTNIDSQDEYITQETDEALSDNDCEEDSDSSSSSSSSSLGSSTSCSEASFELGSVERFEIEHHHHHSHLHLNLNLNTANPSGKNLYVKDRRLAAFEEEESAFGDSPTESALKSVKNYVDSINLVENRTASDLDSIAVFSSQEFFLSENRSSDSNFFDKNCENLGNSQKNHKIVEKLPAKLSVKFKSHIDEELSKLDTSLPEFDFEKLERHLTDAVKEREMSQRQIISEEVRKRLALDHGNDSEISENEENFPYPHLTIPQFQPHKRPNRAKSKPNMNLQICFVNDGLPSEDDEDEDEDEDDDSGRGGVPKSFSTPNLRTQSGKNQVSALGRSISNGGDSEKRASELRKAALEQQRLDDEDFVKRRTRLECETKLMLAKAKQAARMQMEVEKQAVMKRSKSAIEEIIGLSIGKRKLSRTQLSKMCITQLLIIINDLHSRIQAHNEELVHLLIERDSLHMEQDSMLVDIEDLLQHQKATEVKMPDFLATGQAENNNNTIINMNKNGICKQNSNKSSRFRIFKR